MNFRTLGNKAAPTLMLIPGLGVSYEIFLPLVGLLEDRFHIIAVEVDGFTLDRHTDFTSVDDQASQIVEYVPAILMLPMDSLWVVRSCLVFLKEMKWS